MTIQAYIAGNKTSCRDPLRHSTYLPIRQAPPSYLDSIKASFWTITCFDSMTLKAKFDQCLTYTDVF